MLKVLYAAKKGAVEKDAEKKENARTNQRKKRNQRNRKNHATNVQMFKGSNVQKNAEEQKNVAVNPKNRSKIDVRGNAQGTARTANGKKETLKVLCFAQEGLHKMTQNQVMHCHQLV